MKRVVATLILASFSTVAIARFFSVPVNIGVVAHRNACPAKGVVSGPPGAKIIVRDGPGVGYHQLDSLPDGQTLWLCESSFNDWAGIVYAPVNSDVDCGVSSPVSERRPYRGPCEMGWIDPKWIKIVADEP
jgi:hypothetical protein